MMIKKIIVAVKKKNGDEVINFFILIVAILIGIIAWWSTDISERPLMRTVLILERRTARHTLPDGQNTLGEIRDPNDLPSEPNQLETERKSSQSEREINNSMEMNSEEQCNNLNINSEGIESAMSSPGELHP